MDHDQSPIEGPLAELQPVRVEPVIEARPQRLACSSSCWQRYHYLGHRNCLGENLRYLAQDRQGRPLACLLFGSAAWKAAARDQWLGWSSEQRRPSPGTGHQ